MTDTRGQGTPDGSAGSGRVPRPVAVIGLICALVLGWSLPRGFAYDDLVRENLALKARLRDVDAKVAEVDRILLRLRVYDAQLRSVADPTGDHGPLPLAVHPGPTAPTRPAGRPGAVPPVLPLPEPGTGVVGEPMEPIGDADWTALQAEAGLLGPVGWVEGVEGRATELLAQLARTEPEVSRLVGDLEELRALDLALPRVWPASGVITSTFGWRHNPMGGRGWDHHSGVDISAKIGAPIRAPASAVVRSAEYNSGYGNLIELDHGFGITTLYAHCHSFRTRPGDRVEAGQIIALMGNTGRSTGPHLHFEVRVDGHAVDPMDYLRK